MGTKSTLGEDSDLPEPNLCDEWLVEVNDDSTRSHTNSLIVLYSDDRINRLVPFSWRGALSNWQLSSINRGSFGPGHEQPGYFFDSANLLAQPEGLRPEEDNVNQETDDFHDSDAEDIYDLYLAVNGVLHEDLLDIRKLDELTPEEAKILNVPRLKEIWDHTATGCPKCEEIVKTLNMVRKVLREDANNETTPEVTAVDQFDSISH